MVHVPATPTTIEFGFGRADISVFEPDMTMMGWGVRSNRARRVGVPLSARASALRDPRTGTRVVFVSLETLLVTQGLWFAVLDALAKDHPELGLDAHNVVLAATHTHSGPSGFGHHFWTNLNAPGWSLPVFTALRDGVIAAIRDAFRALQPGTAAVAQTVVPLGEGVAFNRSWFAYNKNRDVAPVTRARRDEATDRVLTVVRFRDGAGRLRGLMHWFASHGTCVHADNVELHPDHKGLAALALEAEGLGVVMMQECCGDVSPNYRWDARRGHTMGRFDDDRQSAAWVADVQLRHARTIPDAREVPLGGALEVGARFVDFAAAEIDARWSDDGRAHVTRRARLGLSMAEGTAEGPGPLRNARWLTRTLSGVAAARDRVRGLVTGARAWDPQVPFIDLARGKDGRLAGLVPMARMPAFDATFAWARDAVRDGGVHDGAWVPEVVPLHLVRLGPLAIAALPFETTTVGGRRLRAALQSALGPGVSHIVVSPYASCYVGYLTTLEEYQVQHYEAGYTLFGPHTLGAVRTAFHGLAKDLGRTSLAGPPPPRVATEPLERIAFRGPI